MPRIVRFHELGDAEVMKLEDVPVPEPGPGEVRIRVEAIGLNRAEVLFRQGRYVESPVLPSKLGYEASGVVEAVGPKVTSAKPGDRITTLPSFSMRDYGVYGEVAIVPGRSLAPWPEGLSAEQAAAVWVQYITAYGALVEIGRIGPGDAVIITAASSSVGYAAIQIARAAGATAIATTRTSAKKAMIAGQGAHHVIATQEEDLPKRVAEITGGRGARLIFDAVAGPGVEALAQAAAPGAEILIYGSLDPGPTPFPLLAAFARGFTMRAYTLWPVVSNPGTLRRCQDYVLGGLASGSLRPVMDRTFPLDGIVEAHRYMESNGQNGKITVKV